MHLSPQLGGKLHFQQNTRHSVALGRLACALMYTVKFRAVMGGYSVLLARRFGDSRFVIGSAWGFLTDQPTRRSA